MDTQILDPDFLTLVLSFATFTAQWFLALTAPSRSYAFSISSFLPFLFQTHTHLAFILFLTRADV
jgi:hypothetical protein